MRDNWQTITTTAPGDPSDVADIHNSSKYSITLEENLQDLGDIDDLDRFFDGPDSYTEAEYYAWHG